jgi:hypothetical protein
MSKEDRENKQNFFALPKFAILLENAKYLKLNLYFLI